MSYARRFFGFASWACILGFAACGGKVTGDPGGSAGGDMSGTTTGSGTRTSGATGSGSTGSATTGVGGNTGGPQVTCDTVCQRFVASGCGQMSLPDCVQGCELIRMEFPNCDPLYDDYLLCLQTAPLLCNADGSNPMAPQCDGFVQKLEVCTGGPPPPPPPPPTVDAGPPVLCGGMVPPGPMSCSGGGGSAAATSTGGGPPTCFTDCTDRNNNTWESRCMGTSCSCLYNGVQYCTCVVAGPSCLQAPACCPGSP
jgi:hypothetical protein